MKKITAILIVLVVVHADEIQFRLGDGFHLEDNQGIPYQNSIPLVYDLQWADLQKDQDLGLNAPKWNQCYKNDTCTLRKILRASYNTVNLQLDQLEPNIESVFSKQKRFASIIGWIMKQCCGVATQDEFNDLYRDEIRMNSHVQSMKETVHEDHRALSEVITSSNSLAKEFNGVLDKTKQAVTDVMLTELKIEEREELFTQHLVTVYKLLSRLTQKMRKNIAANACQNKRIPVTIIRPDLLRTDLQKLEISMTTNKWELSIPATEIGRYYSLQIASCSMSKERIVVRIKIPIRQAKKSWRSYNVKAIPIGDVNSTCMTVLPSERLIMSSTEAKAAWITDNKHCQPEINQLCYIPRGTRPSLLPTLREKIVTKCYSSTEPLLTYLGQDTFAITHPPQQIQFHCGGYKEIKFLNLPVVIHGYLEVHVPCDCVVIITEELVIELQFPCDNAWTTNLTTYHIIPNNWTQIQAENITALNNNNSMTYGEKIKQILNEDWEVRSKFVRINSETEYKNDQDLGWYDEWKSTVSDFHLEWTTVVTLLVVVMLFRKPINILLVRLVSRTPHRHGEMEMRSRTDPNAY